MKGRKPEERKKEKKTEKGFVISHKKFRLTKFIFRIIQKFDIGKNKQHTFLKQKNVKLLDYRQLHLQCSLKHAVLPIEY
jgi:hypothetical protein